MKWPVCGKECNECGRLNHFQNRCKRNNVQQLQRSESDNEFEVGMLTTVNSVGDNRPAMIMLDVGQKTTCQPDSKAIVDCCVLPRDEFVRVTGDESMAILKQVKASYFTTTA